MAVRSRFPSVSLSLSVHLSVTGPDLQDRDYWIIIHISGIIWVRVTRFGVVMNVDVV